MQCTPESKVFLENYKDLHFLDCSDSGYSGLFQSPRDISEFDSCKVPSPAEFNETPKENIKFAVIAKERNKESVRLLGKDSREVLRPSAVNWCETPKVHKRDASLRHRLLMCKSTTVRNDNIRSPSAIKTESSMGVRSEHWLSESFDSLDIMTGGASSTLKLDQDLPLSGRKRRLLFTQMRTSTLEDGKLIPSHLSFSSSVSLTEMDLNENTSASDQHQVDTPCSGKPLPVSVKENSESPVNGDLNIQCDGSSVLSTPSFTQTPKYIRSLCEDSGFSSLTLDKSQDSSIDHDGSFQELLFCSKGNCGTPNPSDTKRRSHLQRQHRLSTLKEGGSQSDEDLTDRKHHHPLNFHSHIKEDDVFDSDSTPCRVLTDKCFNNLPSDSLASSKHNYNTPLRVTAKKLESVAPYNADSSSQAISPLRKMSLNLSLTPALQLVHAMCQHRVQMFAGQSPSLKEELKSTAALAKTPVAFRTTMPLAGLIGRKMGLGKVDILTELKKRNLRHILAAIFNNLSPESIYRCGQVCKSWNEIIRHDKHASLRRRNHLDEVEAALEFGTSVHISEAVTLLKRSALKTVQVQSRTSIYCTPQSSSSTLTPVQHGTSASGSKRDKFLERLWQSVWWPSQKGQSTSRKRSKQAECKKTLTRTGTEWLLFCNAKVDFSILHFFH
ncbi:F-box only protein 43 isoform 2-T2 [Menidia menidia]